MHSPASSNDKDPYKVKCHIRAQCVCVGGGYQISNFLHIKKKSKSVAKKIMDIFHFLWHFFLKAPLRIWGMELSESQGIKENPIQTNRKHYVTWSNLQETQKRKLHSKCMILMVFSFYFLAGKPEFNIWLCMCVCVMCGVCVVVSPGWMRCSDQSERKDNCTVTISVYSICVRTAVATT